MPGCGSIRAFWSVAGQGKKIPLGFARRDFVQGLQATKKKLRPCLFPQKVGSAAEATSQVSRCSTCSAEFRWGETRGDRVYKRTAEAQRDFLRGGQELSSLTLSQLRGEIAWEFEKLPFCYAKPQFSRR